MPELLPHGPQFFNIVLSNHSDLLCQTSIFLNQNHRFAKWEFLLIFFSFFNIQGFSIKLIKRSIKQIYRNLLIAGFI